MHLPDQGGINKVKSILIRLTLVTADTMMGAKTLFTATTRPGNGKLRLTDIRPAVAAPGKGRTTGHW